MDGFIAAVGHTIAVGSSKVRFLVGASLSEPHTSGTVLQKCVNVHTYIRACLRPYTVNFK